MCVCFFFFLLMLHFRSALDFIANLEADRLNIDPAEFDKQVSEATARVKQARGRSGAEAYGDAYINKAMLPNK